MGVTTVSGPNNSDPPEVVFIISWKMQDLGDVCLTALLLGDGNGGNHADDL